MLIKINKQPIEVSYEEESERGVQWFGLCISTIAFTSILSLLDYISYLFVGTHTIPFIKPVTQFILHLIGA